MMTHRSVSTWPTILTAVPLKIASISGATISILGAGTLLITSRDLMSVLRSLRITPCLFSLPNMVAMPSSLVGSARSVLSILIPWQMSGLVELSTCIFRKRMIMVCTPPVPLLLPLLSR